MSREFEFANQIKQDIRMVGARGRTIMVSVELSRCDGGFTYLEARDEGVAVTPDVKDRTVNNNGLTRERENGANRTNERLDE